MIEAVARLAAGRPSTPRGVPVGRMMLLACGCLLLASIAFVYAVKTTTPANAAFLASVTPLVAVLLAKVDAGRTADAGDDRRRRRSRSSACASRSLGDLEAGNLTGNVAALLSSVGFAGYAVCLRTDPRRDWSPVMPGYARDDDRALRRDHRRQG